LSANHATLRAADVPGATFRPFRTPLFNPVYEPDVMTFERDHRIDFFAVWH
jgi:hypothetical protein